MKEFNNYEILSLSVLSCLWLGGGWAVCAGFGRFSFCFCFFFVFCCFSVVSFSTINKVIAGEKL